MWRKFYFIFTSGLVSNVIKIVLSNFPSQNLSLRRSYVLVHKIVEEEARPMDPKGLTHLRIAVCGRKHVGKTFLLEKLTQSRHKNFITKPYMTTSDNRNKIINGDVVMEFVEGVQNRVDAFILLFSIDDQSSFGYIEQLRSDIITYRGKHTPIIIVGNKNDVATREVPHAITDCVVSIDWDLKYMEISAKTGCDIDLILPSLFRHAFFKNSRFRFNHEGPRRCSKIFGRMPAQTEKENFGKVKNCRSKSTGALVALNAFNETEELRRSSGTRFLKSRLRTSQSFEKTVNIPDPTSVVIDRTSIRDSQKASESKMNELGIIGENVVDANDRMLSSSKGNRLGKFIRFFFK